MRLLISSLILSGATFLAYFNNGGLDRWAVPIDDQFMGEMRGSDPYSGSGAVDVCAAQNLTPGQGQQTAADCATQTQYPFGVCIDCGSQIDLVIATYENSGVGETSATRSCSLNVMKTGECIRNPANDYYCANAVPDANNSPCAGSVHLLADQGLVGP